MKHSENVKTYYENNTLKFLIFHRDAATKSIHQPLWKSDNFTQKEAILYANKLILEIIQQYPQRDDLNIIDLGCGVGSSIFYLLDRLGKKTNYYGISISDTQISIAQREWQKRKQVYSSEVSIQFISADFTRLPTTLPQLDIAFSIEAFVHSPSPVAYLQAISKYLKKGGKLILIDDFMQDDIQISKLNKKSQKAISDFKYGWMTNSLISVKDLSRLAIQFELKILEVEDLTIYMRNGTLKHKWIGFLVAAFRWLYELLPKKSTYFRSWIGGKGKQYCLKQGLVRYKKVILEKTI